MRDRVSRARDRLPDEVDEPIIAKEEADANPVLWLTFTSDRFSRTELTDLVDRIAKQRIQTVPGVGTIFIGGERRYAMRLWLDPDKLASYQLTASDVEDALREQNVDVPGGRIESFAREFTVRTQGELANAAAFEELIIATRGNSQIKLKDVGRAELGSRGLPHPHVFQRRAHRRPRRRPPVEIQSVGSGRRREEPDPGDRVRAAGRHQGGGRL